MREEREGAGGGQVHVSCDGFWLQLELNPVVPRVGKLEKNNDNLLATKTE